MWCHPIRNCQNLPVAWVVWEPEPNLKVAAASWIIAGGAHHTSFSQALTVDYLRDFTKMSGMEFILIDRDSDLVSLKKELRWNEGYYPLMKGI